MYKMMPSLQLPSINALCSKLFEKQTQNHTNFTYEYRKRMLPTNKVYISVHHFPVLFSFVSNSCIYGCLSLQVNLIIPIFMLLASVYFVLAPVIDDPAVEILYAFLFICAGLIVYFPFVYFKYKLPYMGKYRHCYHFDVRF